MKTENKNLMIKVFAIWAAITVYYFPFSGSKPMGWSYFFDVFRVYLAGGIATFLLNLKWPKMNIFSYAALSIISTLFCWTLIMMIIMPFHTQVSFSDALAMLAITPLAIFLLYKKFAISYLVIVAILFIYNKIQKKQNLIEVGSQ